MGTKVLNSPMERRSGSFHISRRQLVLYALIYLFFVVYGSLVPLEFQYRPLAEAWATFRDMSSMSLSFSSRTDWLVNIALFIPLAFLLTGILGMHTHRVITATVVVCGVLAICLGLSVAIEFTQLFFPRTPSLNDIFAQTIGTGLGITAWIAFGPRLLDWFISWRSAHAPLDIWKRLLYSYLFILFGYSLLPLDLTISPIEILHKWREGRVILLPFSFAFADPVEAIFALVVDTIVWMPAAFLWYLAFPQSWMRSWLSLVGTATVLEFLQLFVYSRVSDTTDILTAAIGAAIGISLTGRVPRIGVRKETQSLFHPSWMWLLLAVVWLFVLAAIFLYPFDFRWDHEFLAERLQGARKVPFEVYYFGTEYRAATELMHKTGFFLPLGALLALAVMPIQDYVWRRYAGTAVIAAIGLAALGIEAGQLFIPGKNVDVTDWVLEVLGGITGFAIIRYVYPLLSHTDRKTTVSPPHVLDAINSTAGDSIRQKSRHLLAVLGTDRKTTVSLPRVLDKINSTGGDSTRQQSRRLLTVLGMGIGILAAVVWLITRSNLMPYNVRELIDERHPFPSSILLAGSIYWMMGFPVLIVRWLARGELYLLSLPLLALIHGLVAWMLLRFAVPTESIYDIVGSPVLDWPWEWEMLGRFIALFSFWTVTATVGGIVAAWRILPGNRFALLGWTIGACLLIPFSYYVVIEAAATDNLVELIAGNGSVGSFLLITLAVALITFGGTKIALALIPTATHRKRAAVWMLVSGVLSYLALYLGLEQVIIKYGQVFSAMQFLLSSDRAQLAGPGELLLRYAVLYVGMVVAMALVQNPIWQSFTRLLPRSRRIMGITPADNPSA